MKFLIMIILIISSEAPVRSSVITAYCDLHWNEGYNSWEECYERHINTKGPTVFLAIK